MAKSCVPRPQELLGCLKSCIRSKKLLRRFVGKLNSPFSNLTINYSHRNRAFHDGTSRNFCEHWLDTMNRWNFLRRGSDSFENQLEFTTKKFLNMEKLQEIIVKLVLFEWWSFRICISFCLWEACFFQDRFNFITFYK